MELIKRTYRISQDEDAIIKRAAKKLKISENKAHRWIVRLAKHSAVLDDMKRFTTH